MPTYFFLWFLTCAGLIVVVARVAIFGSSAKRTPGLRACGWALVAMLTWLSPVAQVPLSEFALNRALAVVDAHRGRPFSELSLVLGEPDRTGLTANYKIAPWYAPLPGTLRVDLVPDQDGRLKEYHVND